MIYYVTDLICAHKNYVSLNYGPKQKVLVGNYTFLQRIFEIEKLLTFFNELESVIIFIVCIRRWSFH